MTALLKKVSEGLKYSRFVVVVLSKNSLEKNWARNELEASLSIELSSGKIKVLPPFSWNRDRGKRTLDYYPLLIPSYT